MNVFEDPQNWEDIRLVDIVDPKGAGKKNRKRNTVFLRD